MAAVTGKIFAATLSYCVLVSQVSSQGLNVNITEEGDYTIVKSDGSIWLRSAPTFFLINNVTYSSSDASLTLLGLNNTMTPSGIEYKLYYQANDTDITATIAVSTVNVITFTVVFPNGANGTKAESPDDVICGFPGFLIDPAPARFAYLNYGLSTMGSSIGRWENGSVTLQTGRLGSGLLSLFAKNNDTIVLGPSSAYTLTSLWHDVTQDAVYWGIMGSVTQLPAAFEYSVSVLESSGRVGLGLGMWTMAVKSGMFSPNERAISPEAIPEDLINTLGYWTSPGSAYYNRPTSETNGTAEDLLVEIRQDSLTDSPRFPRLPYTHMELDDWWYDKGQGAGVKSWTANTTLLPDGLNGLVNKTHWPMAMSCGVWAPDTVYAKQNGGDYDFLMGDACALPNDQNFWDTLLNKSMETDLRIFVQKDMQKQYTCVTSNANDVDVAMTWLSQLNVSATQNAVQVIFMDAVPRLVMETALGLSISPAVEVGPGEASDPDHWRVGLNNLFVSALGLKPFFGTIQSNKSDAGPASQLSPELSSLLATLTGGPVAIGDQLGYSDRQLILRCCAANGRVLPALHPATAIDAQLQQIAWGGEMGPVGEVWTTFTGNMIDSEDNNFFNGIIMATDMSQPYQITPSTAGFVFVGDVSKKMYRPVKLFSYANPKTLYDFADDLPFTLSNCTLEKFCLYHVAPIIELKDREVVLLGDLNKWVPMSSERVANIETGDTIRVNIMGEPNERVFFWFHLDQQLKFVEHRIGPDGTGTVVIELESVISSSWTLKCYQSFVVCFTLLAFFFKF